MKRLAAFFRGGSSAPEQPSVDGEAAVLKCLEHGFPHRPSSLAFSPDMRVLGIGSQSGEFKLIGRPGVELVARHTDPETSVQQILFLHRQLRLVTVGSENDIRLWNILEENGKSKLVEHKAFTLVYPSVKRVSIVCHPRDSGHLMVGTESGNVFSVVLDTMSFTNRQEDIIFWNQATEPSQGTNKLHPGSVEALEDCPVDAQKLLIGYEKGTIVLWNLATKSAERNFPPIQYLGSASWHRDGQMFVSSHDDGSYAFWSAEEENAEHGQCLKPYSTLQECRRISKVIWKGTQEYPVVVFEGGLPRVDYGDRFCVTVQRGADLTAFDFTSRVINFEVIDGEKEAEVLMVLLEEELVAIDLLSPGMPPIRKPYLYSVHDSPLTCVHHVTGVPQDFWLHLQEVYNRQVSGSTRPWPADGGVVTNVEEKDEHDIIITGHEDGSVKFWDASNACFRLLYKLSTANLFANVDGPPDEDPEPEDSQRWPPFVKMGTFDPFCDDPRLAIMQVELCPVSRVLAVAGFGGQIITFDFSTSAANIPVQGVRVEVKLDGEDISRKLGEILEVKGGVLDLAAGFQASCCFVLCPPSPVIAMALGTRWGIVAFGCRRGVVVADYLQAQQLAVECTIAADESRGTLSRLQSIRKSVRLTMRRFRASTRMVYARRLRTDHVSQQLAGAADTGTKQRQKRESFEEMTQRRAQLGNGIRCLDICDTFAPSAPELSHLPSVFCALNSGKAFVFSLTLPSDANRHNIPVGIKRLGKELELRHGAPILGFTVLDHSFQFLPKSFESETSKTGPPDQRSPHYAVLCTEEQLKVLTLPTMKCHSKFKLTDLDGSQFQRAGFMKLKDGSVIVGCTTGDGELLIFSLPELHLRVRTEVVRDDDYRALRTFIFSRHGEAFHMRSPSELQRLALTPSAQMERGGVLTICESTATSPTVDISPEAEVPRERVESRSALNSITALISNIFKKDKAAPSPQAKKKPVANDSEQDVRAATPVKATTTTTTTDGPAEEAQVDEPKTPTEPSKPLRLQANAKSSLLPGSGGRGEDFFASEAESAEREQDFVAEILSGAEGYHSPESRTHLTRSRTLPASSSRTKEEKADVPKSLSVSDSTERAPSPTHSHELSKSPTGYSGTATERMLKAAIERREKLKGTEETTERLASGAASFAANCQALSQPNIDKSVSKETLTSAASQNHLKDTDEVFEETWPQERAIEPVATPGTVTSKDAVDSNIKRKKTKSVKKKWWHFG